MTTSSVGRQRESRGDSSREIHGLALSLAEPGPGLTWLDVGCGKGDVLRTVRDDHRPAALTGVDLIDWLADDLRGDVEMIVGPAEDAGMGSPDRILMIEVIEHLDAPWTVLRIAAEALAPGGLIVVSTPSLTNLRHRGELLLRGRLTSFRPDNLPHSTPALPHITERVLVEAGLETGVIYGARDIIPGTGGRHWPETIHRQAPELTSVSVFVVGHRPPKAVDRG